MSEEDNQTMLDWIDENLGKGQDGNPIRPGSFEWSDTVMAYKQYLFVQEQKVQRQHANEQRAMFNWIDTTFGKGQDGKRIRPGSFEWSDAALTYKQYLIEAKQKKQAQEALEYQSMLGWIDSNFGNGQDGSPIRPGSFEWDDAVMAYRYHQEQERLKAEQIAQLMQTNASA